LAFGCHCRPCISVPDGHKNQPGSAHSCALEHFHFYSEQDRAAKCGLSSTPAS
jgi:hypothetical protein